MSVSARMEASRFRRLMSRWPTGVAVIACDDAGAPAGCTANAITSLSLDPPQLLVCFDLRARTLAALRRCGRFSVNVLGTDQEAVCRAFASTASHGEKFSHVRYRRELGTILLEGCAATIVCDVAGEIVQGDHAIVVADVVDGDAGAARSPLVFFESCYGQVTRGVDERRVAP